MNATKRIGVILLLLFLYVQAQGGISLIPATQEVTRLTWVYEKDQGNVPSPARGLLRQIHEEDNGIFASEFEKDRVNGLGQVPEQYKVAREAALSNGGGLPCLIVQSGDKVVKIVRNPTIADLQEAIK